jgi:hypothetical protein
MRLDDDIESPCSDEAVGSRHGKVEGSHYFSDADGGTARNTDSAVNKSRGIPLPPAIWEKGQSGSADKGSAHIG